jgi:hypothetical protein
VPRAVVLGFAAMDGLPVEGLPEDEGHTFARTQIRPPIPREDPFNRDDKIITRRRNALEEDLGACLAVLMHQDLPIVVHDADVHRPGVEIDSTVCFMLCGVKAHEVSSSSA